MAIFKFGGKAGKMGRCFLYGPEFLISKKGRERGRRRREKKEGKERDGSSKRIEDDSNDMMATEQKKSIQNTTHNNIKHSFSDQ